MGAMAEPGRQRKRKWRRRIARMAAAGAIVSAGVLILPWLWIGLFEPGPREVELPALPDREHWDVYVVVQARHTTIVVEQPPGWNLGPPGDREAAYLEYGWGDRDWYFAQERGIANAVTAGLLPTSSVVHVAGHAHPPHESQPGHPVYHREFDPAQFRRLLVSIEETFAAPPAEREPLPKNVYRGRFYEARPAYIFWRNCNSWTLNRLARADDAHSAFGVVTEKSAVERLRGFTLVHDR